jgi:hypothetical protein
MQRRVATTRQAILIAASRQEKTMEEIVGSVSEFDSCGSSYEHGFMEGCLSVEGNTKDVCNSAEDAG